MNTKISILFLTCFLSASMLNAMEPVTATLPVVASVATTQVAQTAATIPSVSLLSKMTPSKQTLITAGITAGICGAGIGIYAIHQYGFKKGCGKVWELTKNTWKNHKTAVIGTAATLALGGLGYWRWNNVKDGYNYVATSKATVTSLSGLKTAGEYCKSGWGHFTSGLDKARDFIWTNSSKVRDCVGIAATTGVAVAAAPTAYANVKEAVKSAASYMRTAEEKENKVTPDAHASNQNDNASVSDQQPVVDQAAARIARISVLEKQVATTMPVKEKAKLREELRNLKAAQ